METSPPEFPRTPAVIGTACLLLGFLLAVVVLTVRLNADWGQLGSVVARNPVLCWGLSVGLMLGGAVLIKQVSASESHWAPQHPGRRFRKAVLYTREECPLCDEAVRTLRPYRRYLPNVTMVDVDNDPQLRDNYSSCVPVLELDGRARFRGHINETLLRRLIEGEAPHPDHRPA